MTSLSSILVLISAYRLRLDFLRSQLIYIQDAADFAKLPIDELWTEKAVVEQILIDCAFEDFQLNQSENVGFAISFLSLAQNAPACYKWYFVADQGDLWVKERLLHTAFYRHHDEQVVGSDSSLNRLQKNIICFRELLIDLNNSLSSDTPWSTRLLRYFQAFQEFFF